ncbi:MAG: hypothetical protein V4653_06080 [Pseudomonadota bacterium]
MRDPMHVLASKIHCEAPPDGLTDEQKFALHEFFHVVLAAGYKLYQVVPRDKAAQVIREKFKVVLDAAMAGQDPEGA